MKTRTLKDEMEFNSIIQNLTFKLNRARVFSEACHNSVIPLINDLEITIMPLE